MTPKKHDHLHRVVRISVASSIGIFIVATFVLNSVIPQRHGNVLSQTTAAKRTASTATYSISVDNVSQSPTDSLSGLKRITVALSVKNLSTETLQISPGLEMFLRTDSGQQYNLTAKYLAPGIDIGGPVAAGAQSQLSVDFDLPANSTPLTFVYQPDAGTKPSQIGL